MRGARGAWTAALAIVVLVSAVAVSADNKQKAFENAWVGRHVIVKKPLYSLAYKERGLRGSVTAKQDGLTVVTPFAGIYFQFDGRRRVDDVTSADVRMIAEAVKHAYVKDAMLDEGIVQVIDPVNLVRYEPGTELVVRDVRVKLESVRVSLSMPADDDKDVATTLTVQWPKPLSKSFAERVDVEGLISQFLTTRN